MNLRSYLVVLFATTCCVSVNVAHAQSSNVVVTITGPQSSNVTTRVERFDPKSNQTNVLTKIKFYQNGLLVMDTGRLEGPVLLTTTRVYDKGQIIMHEAWDSKSDVKQRTFLRDGKAVVTEVNSKSESVPDLILFHGKDEEIVTAVKRNEHGELTTVDAAALAEIKRGSKAGTEFMNELSREAGKNRSK